MKRIITITLLVLSAVIILDTFNAWHALAMFYLAGEIPGTRSSISANTMLSFFALLFGFVLARLSNKAIMSIIDRLPAKRSSQRA